MGIAYVVSRDSGTSVAIDGTVGEKRYWDIGRLTFSSNGQRVAYRARRYFGDARVVVGTTEEPAYEWTGQPIFSPNGAAVAYFAAYSTWSGVKYSLVVDAQSGPPYDYVSDPIFSSDSAYVAYRAELRPITFSGAGLFIIVKDLVKGGTRKIDDIHPAQEIKFDEQNGDLIYGADRTRTLVRDEWDFGGKNKDYNDKSPTWIDGKRMSFGKIDLGRFYQRLEFVARGQRAEITPWYGPYRLQYPKSQLEDPRFIKGFIFVVDGVECNIYDEMVPGSHPTYDGPNELHFLATRGSDVLFVREIVEDSTNAIGILSAFNK